MENDMSIDEYLAQGGVLTSPDNVPPRYRAELLLLLTSFVDSILAGAAGFAELINSAPGLKERIASARMVMEMNENAAKLLTVMAGFGIESDRYASLHNWSSRLERSADIGGKRMPGDQRLAVFNYPLRGWCDAVVQTMLLSRAALCQVNDLSRMSYQPAAEAFRNVAPVMESHVLAADAGVAICLDAGEGETAQASVDYWWPRVSLCFGGEETQREKAQFSMGLKHMSNSDQRRQWETEAGQALDKLKLKKPQ